MMVMMVMLLSMMVMVETTQFDLMDQNGPEVHRRVGRNRGRGVLRRLRAESVGKLIVQGYFVAIMGKITSDLVVVDGMDYDGNG